MMGAENSLLACVGNSRLKYLSLLQVFRAESAPNRELRSEIPAKGQLSGNPRKLETSSWGLPPPPRTRAFRRGLIPTRQDPGFPGLFADWDGLWSAAFRLRSSLGRALAPGLRRPEKISKGPEASGSHRLSESLRSASRWIPEMHADFCVRAAAEGIGL